MLQSREDGVVTMKENNKQSCTGSRSGDYMPCIGAEGLHVWQRKV
jgi:hypothetical protein